MSNRLTPKQAADRLGIADENVEVFARLVDALRTPEVRGAELARLCAELDAVNEALHAGIDYPQGAAGVRDLAVLLSLRGDDADGPQPSAPSKTRQSRIDEVVTAFTEGQIDKAMFRKLLDRIEQHTD
ncbi:hypothetical protein ABZ330_21725 [Streptomyces sp. NPDC006172]|uniref:hypothetical protein n=1 Tax=Streptomyces sp. NPDC006172 TaxID=3154470 RepID=UPI0033F70E05